LLNARDAHPFFFGEPLIEPANTGRPQLVLPSREALAPLLRRLIVALGVSRTARRRFLELRGHSGVAQPAIQLVAANDGDDKRNRGDRRGWVNGQVVRPRLANQYAGVHARQERPPIASLSVCPCRGIVREHERRYRGGCLLDRVERVSYVPIRHFRFLRVFVGCAAASRSSAKISSSTGRNTGSTIRHALPRRSRHTPRDDLASQRSEALPVFLKNVPRPIAGKRRNKVLISSFLMSIGLS
jgi:hypothetical protein